MTLAQRRGSAVKLPWALRIVPACCRAIGKTLQRDTVR